MALERLQFCFHNSGKGQGATEYLVILGAVLLVSLVVVSATSASTSSQSSMKQQQSQAYWSSLSPINVVSSKVVDANLVLGLKNVGSSTLRLDGISVGSTNLPIYPYYSGDYYGPAYCSRPNDNFSEPSMTCSLMIGPGEVAYVAAQGAVSGTAAVVDCAGKASTEISDVHFAYSVSGSSITNLVLKGDKPIVSSCSVRTCDENWTKVPGNASLLVNDFCIMTFEARNSNGVAVSQTSGTIWRSISQIDSVSNCSALGAGYHLIRDREWMVVANNVASVAANWNSSTVSVGSLKLGNVGFNSSVSYDGNDPDVGIGNSTAELVLSNGQSVWHFSGNVWEWTDVSVFENKTGTGSNGDDSAGITGGQMPDTFPTTQVSGQVEYTAINTFNSLNYSRPPVSSWDSANGIGKISLNPGYAYGSAYSSTLHGLARGGNWGWLTNAGVWALTTVSAPSRTGYQYYGFRCAR